MLSSKPMLTCILLACSVDFQTFIIGLVLAKFQEEGCHGTWQFRGQFFIPHPTCGPVAHSQKQLHNGKLSFTFVRSIEWF